MNKSESKYYNTALLMDEALLQLLERKDLEFITVKEICERAGVNRSTFYLHYETIGDLVNETVGMMDSKFQACFSESNEHFVGNIQSKDLGDLVLITDNYLKPYLEFIRDNKSIYRASFRNPSGTQANEKFEYMKKYILRPIMSRFDIPTEHQAYYIDYYIDGVMAIIRRWLAEDCKDSVEMICAIIEECVRPENGFAGNQYEK
ncbi:MAG: TetR/AcrR family transcriptional regulator [Oscillospiraceae bacterium]|nr:TetR/AcrR family transcriptional regulator [Oscillospiraceae bacterium]